MKGQLCGIHDQAGVCKLTQLRLGSSPLPEHKFRHNFLDITDPMCLSNDGIETTIHFRLLFQEYAIHRTVFLGKVTPCAFYGVDCSGLNDQEMLALLFYGNDLFN